MSVREIKPPHFVPNTVTPTVFLAGSIEMGAAEDWQTTAKQMFEAEQRKHPFNVVLMNPRRDDWDSSWQQSINNQQFNDQVTWELEGLERADCILVHFDPTTKSPITLMELGLLAKLKPHRTIVHCPHDFWRKGNVDILCNRYYIRQANTLADAVISICKDIRGE